SLLDTLLTPQALDQAAERYSLESGVALALQQQIARGQYRPSPCESLPIETSGKLRVLSIPPVADRALQRVIWDGLAPALDKFFEASSQAYRPGKGTRTAAELIRQADSDGFRWAVRADIHDFFD